MPRPGLWITVGGGKLADSVLNSIDIHEQFSSAVVQSKVKPRSAELALISLNGESVDYLGISQAGRKVATGLITIAVSNIKMVGLSSRELELALPPRLKRYFKIPTEGVNRPTPRL